jgi:uncharacterized protein YcfJ
MKKTVFAAAFLTAFTLPALAESFGDQARVILARPILERIPVSREECWNEVQRGYEERRVTRTDTGAPIGAGTVLGAVIGGVVGHQFGNSSRGRDHGTAAGAVVGGLIGNQIERDQAGPSASREIEVQRRPVERDVQRCRVVDEVREATVGWDVLYEYQGREFSTRMASDPGRFLRVRVDVVPVEEGPRPRRDRPTYR